MLSYPALLKRFFFAPFRQSLSLLFSISGVEQGRRLAGRLKRHVMLLTVVEQAARTWRELGDDFAVDLTASISYYAILSLFPLAIGLVSLFSLVLEADAVEREVLGFFHTYLPGSDGILAANVVAGVNIRGLLGIISAVGLLYSSSLLFGAITRAVNRAWDIPYHRPFYIERPRHFIMTLSVAPLFVLSMTATTALQIIGSEELPGTGTPCLSGTQRYQHPSPPTALRVLPVYIPADLQIRALHPYPLALCVAGCSLGGFPL